MQQYEAILFDFDGVLVDSEPVHYACWTEILSGYGLHLEWDSYCRECIGIADREMLARLRTQREPPFRGGICSWNIRMLASDPVAAGTASSSRACAMNTVWPSHLERPD